ncbi:MAG: hypothetical protein IJ231_04120 [Clostridia bacterium]|nr:hypothetical protein [Clostridia bacterium]
MTKREERVIRAFENCVSDGQFTADYAITLIEDNQRYGWLSEGAKEAFYAWLDEWEAEQAEPEASAPVVTPAEEEEEEAPEEEEEPDEPAAEPEEEAEPEEAPEAEEPAAEEPEAEPEAEEPAE